MGVQLFHAAEGGVLLTEYGEIFLKYAQKHLSDHADMVQEIEAPQAVEEREYADGGFDGAVQYHSERHRGEVRKVLPDWGQGICGAFGGGQRLRERAGQWSLGFRAAQHSC